MRQYNTCALLPQEIVRWDSIAPQLFPENPCIADTAIERFPEGRAVVFVKGMGKLMEHDIVDKLSG